MLKIDILSNLFKVPDQLKADVAAGVFTGAFCSGVFNPWDKALYLTNKYNRPFLLKINFEQPYQSFFATVIQRAFLGSIYYILQGELRCHMYPYLRYDLKFNEAFSQFCVGSIAGSISGLLTNSISAVKYHSWGQENRSFFFYVKEMWSSGGLKPFLNGTKATMARDTVFGSTYEISRNLIRNSVEKDQNSNRSYMSFTINGASAGLATVASGPLNYVRNRQYATPPHKTQPTIPQTLNDVWKESKQYKSLFIKMGFFQRKFNFGWGTARVIVGMGVGQEVFDWSREKIKSSLTNKP